MNLIPRLTSAAIVLVSSCLGLKAADSAGTGSLTNGLIAFLPFEGNATDATGNGFNGSLNGAVLTADRFGNTDRALSFAGGGQHVVLNKVLPDTQEFTFTAWVRPDDERVANLLYEGAAFTPGRDLELATRVGGLLFATFTKVASPGPDPIQTDSVLKVGSWQQVALVLGGTGTKIYLDGKVVGSSSVVSHNIGFHSSAYIGAANHGFQVEYSFKGAMDDIRIYSRGLSDSEVLQLYSFEKGPLPDQDSDGLSDEDESFTYNTSPTDADSDDDGLNDGDEVLVHRTNPLKADSDGDGYTDYTEIFAGKNPRDASDAPAANLGVFPAIELEFFTQLGKSYVVEHSTDLQVWTLHEGPIVGDGKVWKQLLPTRAQEARFYRVVLAP